MASTDKALVCRRCQILPKKSTVESGNDRIVCPGCGLEADLGVAVKAAGLYFSHGELKSFQDRQVRSTRGSKHVKYVPGRLPRIDPPDFIFK